MAVTTLLAMKAEVPGQLGRDEWFKNRRSAAYGLTLFPMLWMANLTVWPFADLAAGGFHLSWPQAMKRLGIECLVFLVIIAVVFLAAPFFRLLSAAPRHHQHASWPPGNAVSRKCALWLLPGYFSVATIASNGIPSWSQSAQWQVFTSLYLMAGSHPQQRFEKLNVELFLLSQQQ